MHKKYVAAIVVAVAIVGPTALAAPAFAHNVLVASTPEDGETLTELPARFSVTTNDAMLELEGSNGFALQIQDAAGAYYGDGCLEVVDATMSMAAALGTPGDYTMLWQAVSEDGHSIDGEIPFSWDPAATVDPSVAQDSPPVCGVSATPEPSASATQPPASAEPIDEVPTSSGVDLATVLWIGGALLVVGIAVAVAIVLAGRRKATE